MAVVRVGAAATLTLSRPTRAAAARAVAVVTAAIAAAVAAAVAAVAAAVALLGLPRSPP